MASSDGMSGKLFMALGVLGLALVAGWYFGSPYLFKEGPPPPTRLGGAEVGTAPAPPDAPLLSDRVRLFFVKGGGDRCLEEHLGKETKVEGQLAVTLKPDGSAENAETKTDPLNPGVAMCINQRYSKGFTFTGPAQRVVYTFTGRWDDGKLVVGQNVSSTEADR